MACWYDRARAPGCPDLPDAPSQPLPDGREMVAVCLVGAARTLSRPHVHRGIATHLLKALRAARADVFAVLKLHDAAPKQDANFNFPAVDDSAGGVTVALASLRPRAVMLDDGGGAPPVNPHCGLAGYLASWKHVERALSQWRPLGRCLDLVEEAEARDRATYSRVLRTRPDLLWIRSHPPLSRLANASIAYADARRPQLDWHYVLPRAGAAAVLRLYERCTPLPAPHCARLRALPDRRLRRASDRACDGALTVFGGLVDAEQVVTNALAEAGCGVHYVRLGLPFVIVRASRPEHDVFCDDARDTKMFRMPCDEMEALAYPGEPLTKRTGSPPPPLPPMMAGAGSARFNREMPWRHTEGESGGLG
jgi:hypothetical protein